METATAKPNAVREAAEQSPEAYEDEHVHAVYESIAGHFSSTRYKPWPFVASFLRERVAVGSIGLDVGCGNGKYLGVRQEAAGLSSVSAVPSSSLPSREDANGGGNPNGSIKKSLGDVYMVGSDRSASLVGIAARRGFEVAVADGLALPFRRGRADFALCIAVIHHLSTRARRVDALRCLLECLRPGGQALVYVWALEQTAASRRGWGAGDEQDLLVPWVMKAGQDKAGRRGKKMPKKNKNKNENMGMGKEKANTTGKANTTKEKEEGGQKKLNGRADNEKGGGGGEEETKGEGERNEGKEREASVGEGGGDVGGSGVEEGEGAEGEGEGESKDKDTTYERFYHLYREGELEEDMRAAGGWVLESGYERDNWWVIAAPSGE